MSERASYYEEVNHKTETAGSVTGLTKQLSEFIATRPKTLFQLPILNGSSWDVVKKRINPGPALLAMNAHQWNLFFHGYAAWLVDSFDFFCVSISVSDIADTFNVKVVSITWGITLLLMLRSVGSLGFGYAADKWGRKWPLIFCYFLFIVLEIGTGFTQNLRQFLAVRALFGIAMGGCYPLAISTSLEDAPVASRGFLSGIYQPAYSGGFILATAFHRAFQFTRHGWRALFWFSAAPAALLILWRLTFGELDYFKELQKTRKIHNDKIKAAREAHELGLNESSDTNRSAESDKNSVTVIEAETRQSNFWTDLIQTLKVEWPVLIYLIFYLSVFNFMSHGSQDLFPTLLTRQRRLSANELTVTNILVNLGGVFGGIFWGQVSEIFGRRLTQIVAITIAGAFIYPTFMVSSRSMITGFGFFLQFSIMGAWGIVPIYLTEMTATTPLRAFISGTAYQVGTLASSASSTIEAELGARFPLPQLGNNAYDYGKVMAIFLGCVCGAQIILTFFGPEKFHQAIKTDFMIEEKDAASKYDKATSTVPGSAEEQVLHVKASK